MELARIDGTVVTSLAHPSTKGWRLVIAQPIDEDGKDLEGPLVVLDRLGAGLHQRVVISSDGVALREAVGDAKSPLRYMVIGLVDEVQA